MRIAVLLACHNRRQKTLSCLKYLFASALPKNFLIEVFLVDDGSIDGTTLAVMENFPSVNIIKGDGSLFWNQGMRLAWNTAIKKQNYNFYFWLNDDTLLDKHAIVECIDCHIEALKADDNDAIIVGACRESVSSVKFSYGGRTKQEQPVIPNGNMQLCEFINGNAVLIPNAIYKSVGILSDKYTHSIGDNDYGLMAIRKGFKCYTTKKFVATCSTNTPPSWSDPKTPLKKRLDSFYSPLGLNIKEYIIFRKKFWGNKWVYYFLIAYAKVIFPSLYFRIKRKPLC